MKLDSLLNTIITAEMKGFPGCSGNLRLRDIRAQQWNILNGDLPLPVAVLNRAALAHNSGLMRGFLKKTGTKISPHGKTTMAPQLFDLQLRDGAWGMTVATVQQMTVCRKFGVERILMANQLVGRQEMGAVLSEMAADDEFDFYCLVDSIKGTEQLATAVQVSGLGRPIKVLLEGGIAGGRAGCRDMSSALQVARSVKEKAPYLALCGIEGFEGVINAGSPEKTAEAVSRFLDYLGQLALACDEKNLFAPGPIIMTAGGSAFFDLVPKRLKAEGINREVEIILRSGCYLSHDSKFLTEIFNQIQSRSPEVLMEGQGLVPALHVWGYIQSLPEAGLAIVNVGKRDISFDIDMPTPALFYRPGTPDAPTGLDGQYQVLSLNDQHTYMKIPEDNCLQIGDMIAFGISHPCTTFDKWQLIYVIDDEYRVEDAILTFF